MWPAPFPAGFCHQEQSPSKNRGNAGSRSALARLQPSVIRGNGSEILTLAQQAGKGRGVDSLHGSEAAVEAARRVLAGEVRPGFQTPAALFGHDFAETIADTRITDL